MTARTGKIDSGTYEVREDLQFEAWVGAFTYGRLWSSEKAQCERSVLIRSIGGENQGKSIDQVE